MKSEPSQAETRKSPTEIGFSIAGIAYFLLLGCAITYLWVIAQDCYISIATFKISKQSASSAETGFAQIALPGLSDSGSADSQIAIGFIDSADLLLELEKEFQLHEHYSAPEKDFFFRLAKDAPLEKRIKYYRKHIFANFDVETGLTLLTVDTFDRNFSKTIAEALLKKTEGFINKINQSVADAQLTFVRGELERSEKNVKDASVAILNLQNSNNIISPDEEISGKLLALQELRMTRLRTDTSLSTLVRDSPESPRIDIMRSQLRSLDEQIAEGLSKLSSPEQSSLNQVLAHYKELELQLDFATKLRTGAVSLFEKHRMDAVSQSRFIMIIQRPFLPEDVGYPLRGYATVTLTVLAILLFMILRVFVRSLLERTGSN